MIQEQKESHCGWSPENKQESGDGWSANGQIKGLIDFCTDFGLCSKGDEKKVTLIRFFKNLLGHRVENSFKEDLHI